MPPGPSRPRWLPNLLLAVAATAVPLLALEAVLRLTGAALPGIYAPDSTRLYRLVPGGRKTFTHLAGNGGAEVDVRINADGFRGPPLRTLGPSDRRVAIYGDSFIEAEVVPDSLSFVRVLEGRLRSRRGPGFEVVNAGVVGYGPDQEVIALSEDLDRLRPNAVVLAIFADNDLGDLVRNKLFRLGPDSQLVRGHPILASDVREFLDDQAHPSGWRRLHLFRWIERRLGKTDNGVLEVPRRRESSGEIRLTADNYVEWALDRSARQFAALTAAGDTVATLLGDNYDVDVATDPSRPSARYKIAVMDRLLAWAGRVTADHGTPLVLLVIPSPIDICDGYDIRVDPRRYPAYDRRRQTRLFDSLAARSGIRTLDLYPAFAAAGACTLYFRHGDLHWNPTGQRLAAGILADSLSSWGIPE